MRGRGVIPGAGAPEATQLWIAARTLESISLLGATVFFSRTIRSDLLFSGYALVFGGVVTAIFVCNSFPACYVEGTGLTTFKVVSEYLIILILLLAAINLFRNRARFDQRIFLLFSAAIFVTMASELAFTFYVGVYDLSILAGHLFKIVSLVLIYLAIIGTGLNQPYNLIFRDLKQNEETLRKERDRIQHYLDTVGVIVVILGRDGKVELINRRGAEILGVPETDIVGMNWFTDFVPEGERERVLDVFRHAVQGESDALRNLENPVMSRDGTERIIAWHDALMTDPKGVVVRVLATGEDITERKHAEESLRESEKRLNLAIEAARLGVWEWDLATDDLTFNPIWAEMIGYGPEELDGHITTWIDLVHPDDLAALHEHLKKSTQGGDPHRSAEYRMRCRDGTWKWILDQWMISGSDAGGRPLRMTGIHLDISEIRKYQDGLKRANKKLNLLADITRHDILNQLMIAVGNLRLAEKMALDEESRSFLEKTRIAAHNIRKEVEFTRDYQNLGMKVPCWQGVEEVVRKTVSMTDTAGVAVDVATGDLEIFADPMFEKVALNLIDNALRHGGHVRGIRVSFDEANGQGLLVFEDDGTGISPENKDAIFESGFGRQTGHGLFLVREILDITGIAIRETGVAGKGARFELLIPPGTFRRGGG